MKLIYWRAEKNYENALKDSLVAGAAAAGIELVIKLAADYRTPEADGALIMGVVKREILWDHQARGLPVLVIDKGYCRDRVALNGGSVPAWWRMCWQDVHPTVYFMRKSRPADRWRRMGLELNDRRIGSDVVILGSSAKFHLTMKLDDPTVWATAVSSVISATSRARIIYRPKPSWKYAVPIPGTTFDHGQKTALIDTLRHAACSVTYGSIACVDSICAGVPCVVFGNGVARPVSGTSFHEIATPHWSPRAQREQWAANLAYCNFTPAEIGDGTAWRILREQLSHAV